MGTAEDSITNSMDMNLSKLWDHKIIEGAALLEQGGATPPWQQLTGQSKQNEAECGKER